MVYNVTNADTDSISFCKEDMSEFSQDEVDNILTEVNAFLPDDIIMEDDGYYENVLISKAKNYVLKERGSDKLIIKGSSFRDSKKEKALIKFLEELIESLIFNKGLEFDIYEKYIKIACNIQDISEWTVKKSITKSLLTNDRANEANVRKAFNGREFTEGSKIFTFKDIDGTIQMINKGEPVFLKSGKPKMIVNKIYRLEEDYCGTYDVEHYVARVYKTLKILENVIDLDKFTKHHLKNGIKLLKENGIIQ